MNIWDFLILAAVGICVIAAVMHIHRNRRAGCSGCCSGCRRSCGHKKEN